MRLYENEVACEVMSEGEGEDREMKDMVTDAELDSMRWVSDKVNGKREVREEKKFTEDW